MGRKAGYLPLPAADRHGDDSTADEDGDLDVSAYHDSFSGFISSLEPKREKPPSRQWDPPYELLIIPLMFAVSAFLPAQAEFIQYRICQQRFADVNEGSPRCDSAEITGAASTYILYLKIAENLPAILVTTILGPLTDQHGRKPAMVMGALGLLILTFGYLLISCLEWPLEMLFVFEVLTSCTGGACLLLMALFSSMVDKVPLSSRTLRIASLEGCLYLGLTSGMLAGGYISENYGYIATFLVITAVSAISILLMLTYPESLKESQRRMVSLKEANIIHALSLISKDWDFVILAIFFVVQIMNRVGMIAVDVLYAKHQFHWGDGVVSYFLAADNLTKATALLVVIPIVSACVRRGDRRRLDIPLLKLGAFGTCAAFLVFGSQPLAVLMWAYLAFGPISGLPVPLIRSIASKRYSEKEQGAVLSALAAVESISMLLGPVVYGGVFPLTVDLYSPMVFLIASGLTFVCFVLVFRLEKTPRPVAERPPTLYVFTPHNDAGEASPASPRRSRAVNNLPIN